MRGKLYTEPAGESVNGITPAGAGKTNTGCNSKNILWDHPRRCGENEDLVLTQRRIGGSPPQVRGKLPPKVGFKWELRITPAGAGKTDDFSPDFIKRRDHPRRCGENSQCLPMSPTTLGSPPQVRGKPQVQGVTAVYTGITPAGAGKTCIAGYLRNRNADHPRRCGENPNLQNMLIYFAGSPPQVRGKPRKKTDAELRRRITPAGAGKTAAKDIFFCLPRDHPRRCGENHGGDAQCIYLQGSPPQVRGKRDACYIGRDGDRITPAGAGKTLWQTPACRS